MNSWLQRTIAPAFADPPPGDEDPRIVRRRRLVVTATLIVGASLLGLSLATRPGDAAFYPLLLAVAVVWAGGGLLSGPLHLGYLPLRGSLRRPVLTPIALGLAAGAAFLAGAGVVRLIEPLRSLVVHVLDHAQRGNVVLVGVLALANAFAEEVFFRGALFAAVERRPVVVSTAVYVLATVATGNAMLVFAALLMGTLFGLLRRASGGVLASALTHLTWSTVMLLALPPVIGR